MKWKMGDGKEIAAEQIENRVRMINEKSLEKEESADQLEKQHKRQNYDTPRRLSTAGTFNYTHLYGKPPIYMHMLYFKSPTHLYIKSSLHT